MNCTKVRETIDDLHAGRLDQDAARAVRVHLDGCPACRAYETDVDLIRHRLSGVATPPVPGTLTEQTFARLRRRGRAPLAAAASVMLAVSVLAGVLVSQLTPPDQPEVANRAPAIEERTVRLAVNAPRALESVRFRIDLPDAVEIQGHPSSRTLEWTDSLAAGRNRLDIPLLISGEPRGELVARVEYEGRTRELPISLASAGNPNGGR